MLVELHGASLHLAPMGLARRFGPGKSFAATRAPVPSVGPATYTGGLVTAPGIGVGRRNQTIVIFCAAVGFALLYATQPLLPLLAEEWGRSIGDTALLTTATMIPLALGPLVYGYLLEHVSTRHLLTAAFGILTAAQFALAAGPDYPVFLALLTLLLIGVLVLSLLLRHARVQADPAVAD